MRDNNLSFVPFAGDTYYDWYESPIGKLLVAGNQSALVSITFPNKKVQPEAHWIKDNRGIKDDRELTETFNQLDHYFNGNLKKFNLPLAPHGTPFQKNVWLQLLQIPYADTCSYLDIARNLGNKNATRAVGNANGRNPIPIIIPCHRVIGSNGSLTGFGGGLSTKSYLLDLENSDQLCLSL